MYPIIIPAINNITLLRIKVERNKMTDSTNAAPMKAPNKIAKKPDRENVAVAMLPPPANITKATPKLAPELMPNIEGPANGLLNAVCSINPDTAKAAPLNIAVMVCGKRVSHTINCQPAFSCSFPIRMSQTSAKGMLTVPTAKFAMTSSITSTTKTPLQI